MNWQPAYWVFCLILLVVTLDLVIWRLSKTKYGGSTSSDFTIFGYRSPIINWIRNLKVRFANQKKAGLTKNRAFDLLEVLLVILWALWITKPYADFNPEVWPRGSDFPRNIQLFSTWQNLLRCGDCVLWNGAINGGAPAFADMFTPVLNPFFIISTMLWDVINGSKVLLIFSFILAGLSQLWLGRVIGLSRLARVWAAIMVVAGGHLSSRMEMGQIVMVIPIAAASLVIPAALDVARTGRRRSVVLLALTMSLAIVSGHGYMQIALLVGLLPALFLYWFDQQSGLRPVWRSFFWAAILTILLTAIFWLPLIHFWPNIQKESDPNFTESQSIGNGLLNLVVSDRQFLSSEILGKKPFLSFYGMYIGWVPIILVFFAFRFVPRREIRTFSALLLSIVLIYFASSAQLFKWLPEDYSTFFSAGRNLSLMQPLAIPMIMALAGWGLDGLLSLPWPRIFFDQHNPILNVSLAVLLIIPLLSGVNSVYKYSKDWIITETVLDADFPMMGLTNPSARWVALPDDFRAFPKAIEGRLKTIIYRDFTAWNWSERTIPLPEIELTRDAAFRSDPSYAHDLGPFVMLEHSDRPYAYIQTQSGDVPCDAKALGGHIDVFCQTTLPGFLVVNESYFSGWKALVNGEPEQISGEGSLMRVKIPAGKSEILLRYRPWDVRVGGVLTLFGLIMCLYIWWRPINGLPESVPLSEVTQIR